MVRILEQYIQSLQKNKVLENFVNNTNVDMVVLVDIFNYDNQDTNFSILGFNMQSHSDVTLLFNEFRITRTML